MKKIKAFLGMPILLGKNVFNKKCSQYGELVGASFDDKVAHLEMLNELDFLAGALADLIGIYSELQLHQVNGGEWLVDLFISEMVDNKFSYDADSNTIVFDQSSKVFMIDNYLNSLPFIIHVDGATPFNIVHAAMPINDEELQRRIIEGIGLDEDEQEYSIWARLLEDAEIKIKKIKGRCKSSWLTIVGHTIDGGVRQEDNTIDIDVAAYLRNMTLVVSMPSCKVDIVGLDDLHLDVPVELSDITNIVRQQLDMQKKLNERRVQRTQKHVKHSKLFIGANDQNQSGKGNHPDQAKPPQSHIK